MVMLPVPMSNEVVPSGTRVNFLSVLLMLGVTAVGGLGLLLAGSIGSIVRGRWYSANRLGQMRDSVARGTTPQRTFVEQFDSLTTTAKDRAAAARALREFRTSNPCAVPLAELVWMGYGRMLYQQDKVSSTEIRRMAKEVYSRSASAYNQLERAYLFRFDTATALTVFHQAHDLSRQDLVVRDMIAKLDASRVGPSPEAIGRFKFDTITLPVDGKPRKLRLEVDLHRNQSATTARVLSTVIQEPSRRNPLLATLTAGSWFRMQARISSFVGPCCARNFAALSAWMVQERSIGRSAGVIALCVQYSPPDSAARPRPPQPSFVLSHPPTSASSRPTRLPSWSSDASNLSRAWGIQAQRLSPPRTCSGAPMSRLTRIRVGLAARRFSLAFVPLLLATLSSVAVGQSSDQGTWQLYYQPSRERVELTFEHYEHGARQHGATSFGVRPTTLHGLPPSQLSSYSGPATFRLVRDAGTFNFEGRLRDGRGTGFFTFSPDSRFPQQLASRGYERPTTDQQYWLALHDVGYAMLDELRAQGYDRPSVNQLVVMGMHGADLDYMRSLSSAGYRVGATRRLVTLRDHGVSRDFIDGLRDAGYRNLSLDDLQELRDHGVTPEFIASLRRFGFTGLTTNQLLEARDHGVTESFIEDFRDLGYTDLRLRDFIRLRDHGVTVGFARQLRSANGRLLSVGELIPRRDRGD
jgi:hypothetical protein